MTEVKTGYYLPNQTGYCLPNQTQNEFSLTSLVEEVNKN